LPGDLRTGADCGVARFAATCEVHPSVVWVKLKALADGARLASDQLWKKAA
jgi:5-methyltetrahydropteroyltriglutamate--homocysteine methyltransferase